MAAYGSILILLGLTLAVVWLLYAAARLLGATGAPRERPANLSGKRPREHAMSRFHARWFLVGLLFLAFDMEMVFMYPWAVVFADIGLMAMVEMGMFLMILLVGVLYAWREGALRWI